MLNEMKASQKRTKLERTIEEFYSLNSEDRKSQAYDYIHKVIIEYQELYAALLLMEMNRAKEV